MMHAKFAFCLFVVLSLIVESTKADGIFGFALVPSEDDFGAEETAVTNFVAGKLGIQKAQIECELRFLEFVDSENGDSEDSEDARDDAVYAFRVQSEGNLSNPDDSMTYDIKDVSYDNLRMLFKGDPTDPLRKSADSRLTSVVGDLIEPALRKNDNLIVAPDNIFGFALAPATADPATFAEENTAVTQFVAQKLGIPGKFIKSVKCETDGDKDAVYAFHVQSGRDLSKSAKSNGIVSYDNEDTLANLRTRFQLESDRKNVVKPFVESSSVVDEEAVLRRKVLKFADHYLSQMAAVLAPTLREKRILIVAQSAKADDEIFGVVVLHPAIAGNSEQEKKAAIQFVESMLEIDIATMKEKFIKCTCILVAYMDHVQDETDGDKDAVYAFRVQVTGSPSGSLSRSATMKGFGSFKNEDTLANLRTRFQEKPDPKDVEEAADYLGNMVKLFAPTLREKRILIVAHE
eukprot:221539_1